MYKYLAFIILIAFACREMPPETPPLENNINPNIILIKQFDMAEYLMGVWSGNSIYALSYFRRLTIDNEFKVIEDSIYRLTYDPPVIAITTYMAINTTGTKMLFVKSRYIDESRGRLYEIDLSLKLGRCIKDSTHNISSAIYYQNDSTCVYYSYGNIDINKIAGYYLLNIISGRDSLIIPHMSEVGSYETVNGFDVNSTTNKLLIPLNYFQQTPKILEYDLISHTLDTLQINFNHRLLWLRSNNNGSKVLYSNFPIGCLSLVASEDSEIGIIDTNTLLKRILDVNTNPYGLSIGILPSWSPDYSHIVFGSAQGPSPDGGRVGSYSLYVLKDVY